MAAWTEDNFGNDDGARRLPGDVDGPSWSPPINGGLSSRSRAPPKLDEDGESLPDCRASRCWALVVRALTRSPPPPRPAHGAAVARQVILAVLRSRHRQAQAQGPDLKVARRKTIDKRPSVGWRAWPNTYHDR